MDRQTARRADLLADRAAGEATVAELRARVRAREARRGGSRPPGRPGLTPHSVPAAAPKRPRKRRAQGSARRRSRVPRQQVIHALEQCPRGGSGLGGGPAQRRREVREIPLVRARVIEPGELARQCPQGRRRGVPPAGLGPGVGGRPRLGRGLGSRSTPLREDGRRPLGTIQGERRTVDGLRLSRGALVSAVPRGAAVAQPAVPALPQAVQTSAAGHADETGWREDGRNGDGGTFSPPTAQSFVRGGRTQELGDDARGPAFGGPLIPACSAAEDHSPGLKPRCWAPRLREIAALPRRSPAAAAVAAWARAVHARYTRANRSRPRPLPVRRRDRRCCARQRAALCAPGAADPGVPQRRLGARILKDLAQLVPFVVEPGVPPDHTAAERRRRHLVTARKIRGGTRSAPDSDAEMALCSRFGTWRAQGLNPLCTCRQLLRESQV